MNDVFDIRKILAMLPHRYPMLLIDKVLEIIPQQSLIALKNVSINEGFFQGHFPGKPIMPGVLILEALAQAAALLTYSSFPELVEEKYLCYFAKIENARFRQTVVPGDQIQLHTKMLRLIGKLGKFEAFATVDRQIVAEAVLFCSLKQEA